ncbi:fungal pheromone mating factor STE2 GPCR-domain-containing protein [Rhypophila decipiens]|uniref:Fungal pheromone mating factor STE2 GPCR-domain-containing protein n=1 Tax=Rhypophila decipiens TaxID=261697 RepID=A0AAN7BB55_9PEZI|nr:fungal pheromone mating factor STE2 GPCR-domain-containing protein [Rhypophila decipiens]
MVSSTNMSVPFDPTQQNITLLGPDQSPITIPITAIDEAYYSSFAQAINFGVQLGATIIMWIIMLVMTPRKRFKVAPTIVNFAALTFTLIRMVVLCLYYVSTWQHLYTVFGPGDYAHVPARDYRLSVVATFFSVPVTILVEMALIVQAWSMLRLWPAAWKLMTAILSLGLVSTTIGFNMAVTITQIKYIVSNGQIYEWLQYAYVCLLTSTICWFAFLFIARLVLHQWETRRILPQLEGISAMDALILTNAILMIIPVIFVALQFVSTVDFLAFTLAQTSVVIVLPLGSLVAQRLSNPSAFSHETTQQSGSHLTLNISASGTSAGVMADANGGRGGSVASRRPLLVPTSSTATTAAAAGSGNRHLGVTSDARFERRGSGHDSAYDKELASIDHLDVEHGGFALGAVRVDRRIESSEERIGGAESS